ncbi:hypothetical protein PR202_gb14833 [Eleusine coracana subsp. coracana]|uniref:Uncharacterized protein n=1 Tax=Eleusine coracana subsp. coracana TaxID=191504 RepID=A0AAV5EVK5_ELECO|nr:hypothetical protein PR202_gb14833 [Eleusine coracana subsp. coracana]
MTPPPPPPSKPYSFVTAGLSAEQIAAIDPDYLRFLRHVRLEAGAYVMEIPSSDGVSPPQVVRYEEEEPLAAPNGAEAPVEATAAEVPSGASPLPVDVEEEEEPLTGQNAVASHDDSKNGEMDSSAAAIVSSSIAPLPVEMGSLVAVEVPAGAAVLPDVAQVVAPTTSPNDGIGCGALLVEEDETPPSAPEPAWYDSDIDESYRRFLEHYSMEMNHAASTFQMGNVLASLEEAQSADNNEQHEVDEENEEEGQEQEQAEEELEEGHEEEQTNNEKEKNKEQRKDKQGEEREDERREETDLEGIIWPTHIIERHESEFKQKLIKALTTKSFSHNEYDTLFAMATKRSPITKERRTRHQEVSYTSPSEMGKSYFDNYPGIFQFLDPSASLATTGPKAPLPRPPPKAYSFDNIGLLVEQITTIDPDYLCFLCHVHLKADAYMMEIPSMDDISPPHVIRYKEEELLVAPNGAKAPVEAETEVSSGASPLLIDIREEAEPLTRETDSSVAAIVSSSVAPLPVEMGSLVAAEVPSGVALLPDVTQIIASATSPNNGIGCRALLVEEDETPSSAPEPAW